MSSKRDTKKERLQWREGDAVMSSCLKQRGEQDKEGHVGVELIKEKGKVTTLNGEKSNIVT